MSDEPAAGPLTEQQFAALVDALAADAGGRGQLLELLREDHPLYDQRGAAAVVRMRGWALLALARPALADEALPLVLEELDAGVDPYLVAAAARALRSYPRPSPALAPFVLRALGQIRYRDEPVSFERYGEYATSDGGASPVRELLATLAWLGPHARGSLAEVEALRTPPAALPRALLRDVERAVEAIRGGAADAGVASPDGGGGAGDCCLPAGLGGVLSWLPGARRACGIGRARFEDHDGRTLTFDEFFRGRVSVVVFFYTRCDNPLKCSLTVTKLARVQKLLAARGLAARVRTAAVTYDPEFDLPARLRAYGINRGVVLDESNRMLRATDGVGALRAHFKLGVNFIESLVNRHRIEAYVLDAEGRVAASFERLHWDERQVVGRAAEVLGEGSVEAETPARAETAAARARRKIASPAWGTLASLAVAFFPKCPICWAGYLSLFGIAGLQRVPYAPWLRPLLVAAMLVNLASVWLRGRATGRMGGFYLVGAGALTILVAKTVPGWEAAAVWGVPLTLAGSLLSAFGAGQQRLPAAAPQRAP
jgi:protein SCO1/2